MSGLASGNEEFVAARVRLGLHTQEDFVLAYERHARSLGAQASISIRQVRRWESARPGWPNRDARHVLASMFGTDLEQLGFQRPPRPTGRPADRTPTAVVQGQRSGAAAHFPSLDPGAAAHLGAALSHASRYTDHELVAHLRGSVDAAARTDSLRGPREALPVTLGLLYAIEVLARDAGDQVRGELLALGARAAELAAWLHRDTGAPARATVFWHDRAIEWATLAGDGAMHAYVLLRKAQAAPSEDAVRMADLARAAHSGPWTLPARPRAEALQQEARALAYAGDATGRIERLLDQAHNVLGAAPLPSQSATCTGELGAGYTTERLMVQTALVYRESTQPARAVDLFRQPLADGTFPPRDRAFFTAALSGALAGVGEVDEAAATALRALALAQGPRFGRALEELRRTAAALRPYSRSATVRELRRGLAKLT